MSTDFVIEYHLMRDTVDEKECCKKVKIQSNIKENRKKWSNMSTRTVESLLWKFHIRAKNYGSLSGEDGERIKEAVEMLQLKLCCTKYLFDLWCVASGKFANFWCNLPTQVTTYFPNLIPNPLSVSIPNEIKFYS